MLVQVTAQRIRLVWQIRATGHDDLPPCMRQLPSLPPALLPGQLPLNVAQLADFPQVCKHPLCTEISQLRLWRCVLLSTASMSSHVHSQKQPMGDKHGAQAVQLQAGNAGVADAGDIRLSST